MLKTKRKWCFSKDFNCLFKLHRLTFLAGFICCRLPWKYMAEAQIAFIWKFIYISNKREIVLIKACVCRKKIQRHKNIFEDKFNWDVSPVLSLHCCIVYSDGLSQTIPILRAQGGTAPIRKRNSQIYHKK